MLRIIEDLNLNPRPCEPDEESRLVPRKQQTAQVGHQEKTENALGLDPDI